jgi:Transcriptional regulator containing PAS, AAA-type ATPase, and DNA-binding domains
MAKNLLIIGYGGDVIDFFTKQIETFMSSARIFKLIIGEPVPEIPEGENILLTESFEGYMKMHAELSNIKLSDILFAGITVGAGGLEKAMDIPRGSDVLVYQSDWEIATRLCKTLIRIGAREIRLTPIGSLEGIDLRGKCIATTHDHMDELGSFKDVYDLGYSVIDLETLLDIGSAFDVPGLLEKMDIMGAPSYLVPLHEGLFKNLESHNRYISSADLLIKMIAGSVISVDNDGSITAINGECEKQFGIEARYVVGKDADELFPFVYFSEALRNHRRVEEYVCKYNNEDLIVSVEPKTNAGKYYGAVAVIKKFREEEKRHHKLRADVQDRGYVAKYTFDDIIGSSEVMRETKNIAMRMARSDSSVLITGENGTGKEMFAQAIHNASSRQPRQFVAVNCGAIPGDLLESELFGYEEGAFTGASKGGKTGIFEMASTGTLFLDEISEMDMALQKKLLRALQEKEVVRVGGNYVIPVNCRIIASSNRDLGLMVANGEFREDLYYRIRVLPLKLPPLREHKSDIPELIDHFAAQFGGKLESTASARNMIMAHQWWGNIRELRNCIEFLISLDRENVDSRDVEELLKTYPNRKDAYKLYDHQPGVREDAAPGHGGAVISGDEMLVLGILADGFEQGRRLGRRSISALAKDRGVFLGEQQVRTILQNLARDGYAVIGKGKAGTVITASGMEAARV